MTEPRLSRSGGKVRQARLTDLAALGELSRLCQQAGVETRSLGLPVAVTPIGVFSLFRLPLAAFRPNDLLFVYEDHGHLAGLLRVERENDRDEWTIVELDAIGASDAGDIRFRLVQQLLRHGPRRGAVRFHVACSDSGGNVELFMQAGFVRYGEERIFFRSDDDPLPEPWSDRTAGEARIRPAVAVDAVALHRLYTALTPAPVQRLEAFRIPDWERHGTQSRVPRSSLAPILRFADVETYVQEAEGGGQDGTQIDGLIQLGVAMEDQPHYLKVLARPGSDPSDLVRFGLGVVAARTSRANGSRSERGVISPVRTYESPVDRRLEEAGFGAVAGVTLLLKEALVRVAEPALVPAGVR